MFIHHYVMTPFLFKKSRSSGFGEHGFITLYMYYGAVKWHQTIKFHTHKLSKQMLDFQRGWICFPCSWRKVPQRPPLALLHISSLLFLSVWWERASRMLVIIKFHREHKYSVSKLNQLDPLSIPYCKHSLPDFLLPLLLSKHTSSFRNKAYIS